jgi:hypothetical protein
MSQGPLSAQFCVSQSAQMLPVDSAHWPEPIRKRLIGTGQHWKTGTKAARQAVLREVGYGVPDLQRAMNSANNDVTLIAPAPIKPFTISESGGPVFNEMHFYDLPWPKVELEKIENGIITMKVTLSYFVEPNLSGRAATRPEIYRSFGLRFAMKKRSELHDAIGVYPVLDWWKTHPGQKRFNDKGRYALVVSISAPGHEVDMYSEISAKVAAKVAMSLIV